MSCVHSSPVHAHAANCVVHSPPVHAHAANCVNKNSVYDSKHVFDCTCVYESTMVVTRLRFLNVFMAIAYDCGGVRAELRDAFICNRNSRCQSGVGMRPTTEKCCTNAARSTTGTHRTSSGCCRSKRSNTPRREAQHLQTWLQAQRFVEGRAQTLEPLTVQGQVLCTRRH